MQLKGMRLALGITAALIGLCGLALVLQVRATSNYHIAVGDASDGGWFNDWRKSWYGRESSTTLPTAKGAQADTYRWTAKEASLEFAPLLSGIPYQLRMRALSQIDGFEATGMRIAAHGEVLYEGMPPDPKRLRIVSILIPPRVFAGDSIPLSIGVVRPIYPPDARELGLLVTDIRMSAVAPFGAQLLAAMRWPWLALSLCVPVGVMLALGSRWRTSLALITGWLAFIGALLLWEPSRHLLHWWGPISLIWAAVILIQRFARARALPITLYAGAIVLALILAIGALPLFVPVIESDGVGYYAYLNSLAKDGDLSFGNQYASHFAGMARRQTVSGMQPNQWAVGSSIAWAPAFGLAELMVRGCSMLTTSCPWATDGYDMAHVTLTMLVSLLAGLGAALIAYRYTVIRFEAQPWSALLSTLGIVVGSSWLYYMTRAPSFPHALSALATALLATLWLGRGQRTWRFWVLIGALSGMIMLLYLVNTLLLLWPALSFLCSLWDLRATPRRLLRQLGYGLLAAGVALLVFSPQIAAWQILYQSWVSPQASVEAAPTRFLAYLGSSFFSPIFGLFFWMPLLGLALAASPLLALMAPRPLRREALLISIALAAFMAYLTSLSIWAGGNGFGQRRLIALAPLLIPVLAALLERARRLWAGLPSLMVVAGSCWTFALMIRFMNRLIPAETHYLGQMRPDELLLSPTSLPLGYIPYAFQSSLLGMVFELRRIDLIVLWLVVCAITMVVLFALLRMFRSRPTPDPQLQEALL
jgi:hypothetical protein